MWKSTLLLLLGKYVAIYFCQQIWIFRCFSATLRVFPTIFQHFSGMLFAISLTCVCVYVGGCVFVFLSIVFFLSILLNEVGKITEFWGFAFRCTVAVRWQFYYQNFAKLFQQNDCIWENQRKSYWFGCRVFVRITKPRNRMMTISRLCESVVVDGWEGVCGWLLVGTSL